MNPNISNRKNEIEGQLPDKISLVVPFYNEAGNVQEFYRRVCVVMDGMENPWDLICVNDGSTDATLTRLLEIQRKDSRIRIVDLSRNFGKEAALTAGLDQANGDAAIPLDADLQDPPELIPRLVEKWKEGFEVVNAMREAREGESLLKRTTAHFFYRIINRLSDVYIPPDTGDFRLLSRPALDGLRQLPERRRFMKGLFGWIGYRTATIHYRREPRHAGKTKWNYWNLWNFALEGITSFSHLPLRLASYIGLIASVLSFSYAVYMIVRTIAFGNPVKGYPSLLVAVFFFGGAQLMALGIIGEYIGRIYEESKHRPIYLVRQIYSANSSISLSPNTPSALNKDISE